MRSSGPGDPGSPRPPRDRHEIRERAGRDGSFLGVNGRPSTCAPLRRVAPASGVDTIDLYYQHRVDRTVPIEDTVGRDAGLVREGRFAFWSLEASPATIRRPHKVHPITALKPSTRSGAATPKTRSFRLP